MRISLHTTTAISRLIMNDRHQEAIEKGVFKSKTPCLTYTFNKY